MVWEVRTTGADTNSGGYRSKQAVNPVPSTPSVSGSTTGGTVAANTYYIVITYTDPYGDTAISAVSSVTTTGATSSITVTKPAASSVTYQGQTISASAWNCYVGTNTNGPFFPQGTALSLASNRVITTTPPTSGTQPLGGSDYSQQNGAQVTVDGVTITGTVQATTTNLKLTGHTVVASEVGNTYLSTGGTATAGNYEIIGISGTDTWIMDRSMGTSTQTSTGAMGGAFASPGKAGQYHVAGNDIWIKNGTYTMSSSSNVSGGVLSLSGNEPAGPGLNGQVIGYNSTRGDLQTTVQRASLSNIPLLQQSSGSQNLITLGGNTTIVDSLQFYSNGQIPGASIVSNGFANQTRRCYANAMGYLYRQLTNSRAFVLDCESNAHTVSAIASGANAVVIRCYVHDASSSSGAIAIGNDSFVSDCIIANYGTGTNGAMQIGDNCFVQNVTVYNTTGSAGNAFYAGSGVFGTILANCLAVGSSQVGFAKSGNPNWFILQNCAGYNNTGGDYTTGGLVTLENFQTLTGDPFANAAGGDFSLNAIAGAGALCRGMGLPGTYPAGLSVSNRDIGAVQTYLPATQRPGGFF